MSTRELEAKKCPVNANKGAYMDVPYSNMIGSSFWHAKIVAAVLNCHNPVSICICIRGESSLYLIWSGMFN